jgi:hypothetical protein
MQKLLSKKWFILLMGLAGLLALDFVAASLANLKFEAPRPYSLPTLPGGEQVGVAAPASDTTILQYIIYSYLFICIISLIIMLFRPEMRKVLIKRLIQLGLFALAAYLVLSANFAPSETENVLNTVEPAPQSSMGNVPGLDDEFAPPQVDPWVQFAVSFGVALAVLAVGGWLAFRLTAKKPQGGVSLDEIAAIARRTVRDLESGQDWDEVIIQCYIRMSEAVSEKRGVYRQSAMTPLEFASKLEKAGLPGEAVRTLTNLFDEVRYGARQADQQKRDLAIAAMNAILSYCGVRA